MDDRHTVKRDGVLRRAVRSVKVEVTAGPDQGASVASEADAALGVGGSPDNALVLTDPTVSRYHLELRATPTGVRVEDLGSLNGTWLGDVRVETATVRAGTELRVGDSVLRVLDGATVETEEEAPPAIAGMVAVSEQMRQWITSRLLARNSSCSRRARHP